MNEPIENLPPQTNDAYFVAAEEGSRHDIFPGVDILLNRRRKDVALGGDFHSSCRRADALASS